MQEQMEPLFVRQSWIRISYWVNSEEDEDDDDEKGQNEEEITSSSRCHGIA